RRPFRSPQWGRSNEPAQRPAVGCSRMASTPPCLSVSIGLVALSKTKASLRLVRVHHRRAQRASRRSAIPRVPTASPPAPLRNVSGERGSPWSGAYRPMSRRQAQVEVGVFHVKRFVDGAGDAIVSEAVEARAAPD